ncbi:MAG: hypothetical protein OEY34_05180 [Cyclobacteriaceae bacterium]|nr:hypothetical protein [Cyclobacteriaceae bacterium]
MNLIKYVLTLVLIFLIKPSFSQNEKNGISIFELVRSEDNVNLYERWVYVEKEVLARELKVTFSLGHNSIDKVFGLIRNPRKFQEWNKGVSNVQIIEEDNYQWMVYSYYDIPWPFSNQDCLLEYKVNLIKTNRMHISFESIVSEKFPPIENVVRLTKLKGMWNIIKQGENILVEYYVSNVPVDGIPPRWLADPIIRNNLLNNFKIFKEIIDK